MKDLTKKLFFRYLRVISPVIRRITQPKKYKTIGFFFDYIKEPNARLNEKAISIKNAVVHEVCTLDTKYESFYFPRKSVCLVSDRVTAQKALAKGALLLITSEDYEEYPCLISDNPVSTYASLCRYFRDLSKSLYVTAISGSIGKTTVKNMIGEVYKKTYPSTYTRANQNTRMSVGFAVQHIPSRAKQLIQEIHEGNPDETRFISKMLHPDLFVLTPIDQSHYERFGSIQKIKEEICSITEYMQDTGTVIVDVDEFNDFDLLNGRNVISISSVNQQADFSISDVEATPKGLSFKVHVKQTLSEYSIELPNIYALHNAQCALYAFAAGFQIGIDPKDIIRGLRSFKTSGDRQNVFTTHDGVIVYADCYNAVGRSMLSAIDAANSINIRGNRIAVLGDIAEAGAISQEMHKSIVKHLNEADFSYLFTIGDEFKKALAVEPTKDALFVKQANDLKELSKAVKEVVKDGDLVLFKASHSSNLSECIRLIWPKEYKETITDTVNSEYDNWLYEVIKY